jgi:hypothetical protein
MGRKISTHPLKKTFLRMWRGFLRAWMGGWVKTPKTFPEKSEK